MKIEAATGQAVVEEAAFEQLSATFGGELIRPHDDGYDDARKVFNAMIDRRPAVIARCSGVADVMDALDFARTCNLPVAVRGGGHAVAGYSVCDDGVVIDLSPMKGVRVDPVARTARAQAGLTWGELDRETQAFGLAVTGGRISSTGIAGLTLGSGSGWLERMFGLSCDNLISADVVTADGRLVTASENENSDLFWGIRGGGGNFGIVTEFEYRLHPVGPIVYGGMLLHTADKAKEVMAFYRDFMASAPDEMGGGLAFVTAPPEPFIPEELQGRQVLAIIVSYFGAPQDGEEVVRPLAEFRSPDFEHAGPMPYVALQQMVDGGNQPGSYNYWKAGFLNELSDAAIDAFIANAKKVASPLTSLLIFPMGGALSRVGDNDTALGYRQAAYNYHAIAMWAEPAESQQHIGWARELDASMKAHCTDGVYLNFTSDQGEERVQASFGDKYQRLAALKDEYDPDNLFSLNQNVKPTRAAPPA